MGVLEERVEYPTPHSETFSGFLAFGNLLVSYITGTLDLPVDQGTSSIFLSFFDYDFLEDHLSYAWT